MFLCKEQKTYVYEASISEAISSVNLHVNKGVLSSLLS